MIQSKSLSNDSFEDKCCKYRYEFSNLEKCCGKNLNSLCCSPLKALHGNSWKACGNDLIADCEVITYRLNGKVIHREMKEILPEIEESDFLSGSKDLYEWKRKGPRKTKRMSMYLPKWIEENLSLIHI